MSWIIITNLLLCGWVIGETCRQKFGHGPLVGFRCVTETETYIRITTRRHICIHQCISTYNCTIANYNIVNDTCFLSMDTCRLLQPDPGFYTNTFTLEQHTHRCIRWISSSEADASLTLVTQECYSWRGIQPCYLGRLRDSNNILPGKYQAHDQKIISVLNDRGYMNGVKELMQVDPGCPAFWVPFTAGTDLYDKAVKGGYLADSSTDLYVMRTLQGENIVAHRPVVL